MITDIVSEELTAYAEPTPNQLVQLTPSAPEVSYEDTVLIAYHANCVDGAASAWVVAGYCESRDVPYTLLPMSYNPESVERMLAKLEAEVYAAYSQLWVIDYSLDLVALRTLQTFCDLEVHIWDHHKTAFERYCPDLVVGPSSIFAGKVHGANVFLRNDLCGAVICGVILYPEKEVPLLLEYVQDYDLWIKELGDTDAIHHQLQELGDDLDRWEHYSRKFMDMRKRLGLIDYARTMWSSYQLMLADIAATAIPTNFLGYPVHCTQCAGKDASIVGNLIAKESPSGISLTYETDISKGETKWSLRSTEVEGSPEGGVDVSALAKAYGGGGHKNAAGFYTAMLPPVTYKGDSYE